MGERGFTLIEVLIAMAILTIGLLGVAGTTLLQSGGIASSITYGQAAVSRGQYVSTAAFCAQSRLEQVKLLSYTLAPPVDQIGGGASPGTAPSTLPDEAFGAITDNCAQSNNPNFSRQVRVLAGTPAPNMKTVTVTVTFRLPTAAGSTNTESVAVGTIIAARP